MPYEIIVIVIELMSLGVNVFWPFLEFILSLACGSTRSRAKNIFLCLPPFHKINNKAQRFKSRDLVFAGQYNKQKAMRWCKMAMTKRLVALIQDSILCC